MIFRKPYAFFIKHFKLFNVILTILQVYLIYKLSFMYHFFSEYANNPMGAIGQDLTGTLLNKLIYIVGFVIIIFSLIMLFILSIKKKSLKLYIFTFIINVFILFLIYKITDVLQICEIQIVDTRTIYAYRDILLIAIILELVMSILTLVRSIGFDIKSFQFGQDLEKMHIDVTDNEEFELNIDVDSSKIKRNIERRKRYFKYFIFEHKFLLLLISAILIGVVSYFIYSKADIYHNATKPNKIIQLDNFDIGTKTSYITNKDYRGNVITDNSLIIIPIEIKTSTTKQKLNTARFALTIDNHSYYHITNYQDKLIDLGTVYKDQIIPNEFTTYLLVFEVPNEYTNKTMYLQYGTVNNQNVKFVIKPQNIDTLNKTFTSNLGNTVIFKNDLIESGTLIINNYEFSDKFKVDYKFCVTNNECYNSYEYIVPDYKNNYDMTILKLNGNMNMIKSNINVSNFPDFVIKFGTLVYTKDGITKRCTNLKQIKPSKTKLDDVYYIEVYDEIKDADDIAFEFKIRNTLYSYKLY